MAAVAIAFLNSYANPLHEETCANALRTRLPGVAVTASHEISRQWREYERTSTTVVLPGQSVRMDSRGLLVIEEQE